MIVKQVINSTFNSNTFIILEESYNYCWLVDIGDFQKVVAIIPSYMEIRGLFLTHTHFDHMYGINELHNAFPNCVVYTTEYGQEALYDDKKNFSRFHETPTIYKGNEVKVMLDGDAFEIFPGVLIKAYETPGHCSSCLSFIVDKWIFTGDSYIPGVKVVTKLPQGNKEIALQSVKKILQLSQDKIICPGHGDVIY